MPESKYNPSVMPNKAISHNFKVMKKRPKPYNFTVIKRRKSLAGDRLQRRFAMIRTLGAHAALLISRMRYDAHLTQADLAERVGTSQPAISRAESGAVYPELELLERIAQACGRKIRLTADLPDHI